MLQPPSALIGKAIALGWAAGESGWVRSIHPPSMIAVLSKSIKKLLNALIADNKKIQP
jgi:hypothetical protein